MLHPYGEELRIVCSLVIHAHRAQNEGQQDADGGNEKRQRLVQKTLRAQEQQGEHGQHAEHDAGEDTHGNNLN